MPALGPKLLLELLAVLDHAAEVLDINVAGSVRVGCQRRRLPECAKAIYPSCGVDAFLYHPPEVALRLGSIVVTK